MTKKFLRHVEAGTFIQVRGHMIQKDLQEMWWKVEERNEIGNGAVHFYLRNRNGKTRNISSRPADNLKAIVWEPGDNREDG